jgi:hypothetical protein
MEKTCDCKENEAVYVNVAILMIEGALDYVSPDHQDGIADRPFDLGGEKGKTFFEVYGYLLSKETKEILDIA